MVGGFGRDTYEPKEPYIEHDDSPGLVRFDGEGEPGELLFAVRSRSKPIRYLVTVRLFKDEEHERGEVACSCEDHWFRYRPDRPTVADAVCWHIKQILKEARKCQRSMTSRRKHSR